MSLARRLEDLDRIMSYEVSLVRHPSRLSDGIRVICVDAAAEHGEYAGSICSCLSGFSDPARLCMKPSPVSRRMPACVRKTDAGHSQLSIAFEVWAIEQLAELPSENHCITILVFTSATPDNCVLALNSAIPHTRSGICCLEIIEDDVNRSITMNKRLLGDMPTFAVEPPATWRMARAEAPLEEHLFLEWLVREYVKHIRDSEQKMRLMMVFPGENLGAWTKAGERSNGRELLTEKMSTSPRTPKGNGVIHNHMDTHPRRMPQSARTRHRVLDEDEKQALLLQQQRWNLEGLSRFKNRRTDRPVRYARNGQGFVGGSSASLVLSSNDDSQNNVASKRERFKSKLKSLLR